MANVFFLIGLCPLLRFYMRPLRRASGAVCFYLEKPDKLCYNI